MDPHAHKWQARMAKALAHPTRVAILERLRGSEMCVCEIEPALELNQANISQHLAVLRDSHLVTTRREGVRVFYHVTDERVFRILDLLGAVAHDYLDEARQALATLQADAA